jgi:hypothetical protein
MREGCGMPKEEINNSMGVPHHQSMGSRLGDNETSSEKPPRPHFQIFGLQFKQKWWTINLWEGELRDVQIGD